MNDLAAAVAARAARLAGPRAADYAEANRLYLVTLSRPDSVEPGFDRATEAFTPIAETTIYYGPARVTPLRPSQVIDIGDAPSHWGAVRVSIGVSDLDPRIDDSLVVNDNELARVARIVGKRFRVTGITEGGLMPIGYSLDCVGVQPSIIEAETP